MRWSEKLKLALKLRAKHKVRKPVAVINAALRADIRVASLLAMLQMETGIPQRNIFGCDHGPGRAFCHQDVTKERVAELQRSGLANGVGWTQLTYPPFVIEAQKLGGAHKPKNQMIVGARILRQNFEQYGSIREMYRAYNGSGDAAENYGIVAEKLRARWLEVTDNR
jgi:hypothetical protein